jgi:hypothetical protein
VLAGALGVAGSHVERDHLDRVRARPADLVEEPVGGLGVAAFVAPDDLAADMVGDEGEIAVLHAPGNLIDPNLKEVLQPVRVQLVLADAGDDPADRVPVDPGQPLDRGLIGPRCQPRDELLEITGEPGAMTRERNTLDPDPCSGH